MLKIAATILFSLALSAIHAQSGFPASWQGNWKGDLHWFKGNAAQPQVVPMSLQIQPAPANQWTWRLTYGSAGADDRPYKLVLKDSATGHWQVDENNGIVLDQYFVAGQLSGAFTVAKSTIVNNYRLAGDSLVVEFYTLSAAPVSQSGKGTDDSPNVSSYKVNGYQKAILRRTDR